MKAEVIEYDPTRSQLDAGTVQNAIDSLSEGTMKVYPDQLKQVDLSTVFEEGIYSYNVNCSHTPMLLEPDSDNNTQKTSGRLIVSHTTNKHITQIALPNANPDTVYIRHYAQVSGTYEWTEWYTVLINTYRWVAKSMDWNGAVSSKGYIRFNGKTINSTNFPSSVFEITMTYATSGFCKYAVYVTTNGIGNTYCIYKSSDSAYIAIDTTSAGNLVAKLVYTGGTAPTSHPDITMHVVKIK